jgi:hypothetical protein
MARPAVVKSADVRRALSGAKAAGMQVGRFEVTSDGRIVVFPASVEADRKKPLDEWLSNNASANTGR